MGVLIALLCSPGPGGRITRTHKPTVMDKLRGTTEQMAGKMTGNSELASRGDERKVRPEHSSL